MEASPSSQVPSSSPASTRFWRRGSSPTTAYSSSLETSKNSSRISGMRHVRTPPNYPQLNGKIECWHKSLKAECIRPGTPLTPEDARRLIHQYVDHYNTVRQHSAIGFVTPVNSWRAGSRKFTRRGTASCKRPVGVGNSAVNKRHEA